MRTSAPEADATTTTPYCNPKLEVHQLDKAGGRPQITGGAISFCREAVKEGKTVFDAGRADPFGMRFAAGGEEVDDESLYASFPSRDASPNLSVSAPRERMLQPQAAHSDTAYWMHEMSFSSLASTDSGYTQQPWLPDELSSHCMRCHRPLHLLRWTHHCRDCGGIFCSSCSSHRVEANMPFGGARVQGGPPLFRLCDGCAFSTHRPTHLGCRNPLSCPRCRRPRGLHQWLLYAQMATRMFLCCGVCCASDTCWCIGAGCVASLDASSLPIRTTPQRQRRRVSCQRVADAPNRNPVPPALSMFSHTQRAQVHPDPLRDGLQRIRAPASPPPASLLMSQPAARRTLISLS